MRERRLDFLKAMEPQSLERAIPMLPAAIPPHGPGATAVLTASMQMGPWLNQ
jgi:hypothetical protein